MILEEELLSEIKKWTSRLEDTIPRTISIDDRGKRMLENIEAYRNDSKHFRGKKDLVRSFECLVWAWALLETGKELGHLSAKT